MFMMGNINQIRDVTIEENNVQTTRTVSESSRVGFSSGKAIITV